MTGPDAPTASTRVAGVIGDPVAHSLSPVLHNAAYRALGVDWVYVAFPVARGRGVEALASMRVLGIAGVSVTMPHKEAVASACDELDADAAALRSVNCVTHLDDDRLHGASTDGEGFLRSLAEVEFDPGGRTVLVLGAGGAARSVAWSLVRAGATVVVSARRQARALEVADLVGGRAVRWDERAEAAGVAELVVHATPLGMGTDAGSALPDGALRPGQLVADLVYHPRRTVLLRDAEAAGAGTLDGLGMLVHQAALQVELWTGSPAPVAAMRAAAERALAAS